LGRIEGKIQKGPGGKGSKEKISRKEIVFGGEDWNMTIKD